MSAASYLGLFEKKPSEQEDPESTGHSRFTGKIDGKMVGAAAKLGKKGLGFAWNMISGGDPKKDGPEPTA